MTYASLKLSFILAEKRQVLSYIFLYVFSVEIFYDKRVQSRIYSSYAERSKKHARRK